MSVAMATNVLTTRLVDTLYTEAMLLADEMRFYFDGPGLVDRETLDPIERVSFACESLKGTTRLMQSIAWLLSRRVPMAGQDESSMAARPRHLEHSPAADPEAIAALPGEARRLIDAGVDLYERVRRLDQGHAVAPSAASPARSLMQRLERSF